MNTRTWSDQQLIEAVQNSRSLRETLITLNLAVAGGTYTHIKTHIKRLSLDTSHWSGQSGKGRLGRNKQLTLNDILTVDSSYPSFQVRQALIRAGLKTNQCENCGLNKWMDQDITIQLHHINGIRSDNRIENLQMLCPNCHSQMK